MWILLGFIIDKDISNVFTLTYPLQFLFALFENVFGRGANIVAKKEKDKNVVDANIIVGCLIIGLISLTLAFNVDRYIEFFNMDVGIYHDFCLYSMISLYFTFVIQILLQKMYFDGKNSIANKVSCLFNLANFFSIVGLSFFIKLRMAITITLIIDTIIVLSVLIKNVRWPKFELKLSKTINYSSFSILRNISMFLTYIIGFNRNFSLGAIYIATINFESMMTDTQWDILYSVDTVSKIDISEGKFDYRKSLKNARMKEFFDDEQREIIRCAIEDHRMGLSGEPRSIYGKIVSSADRNTSVNKCLQRTYGYGIKHYPNYTMDEQVDRAIVVLDEHYNYKNASAEKMYFEDKEYDKFLEDMNSLICDREKFKREFILANEKELD